MKLSRRAILACSAGIAMLAGCTSKQSEPQDDTTETMTDRTPRHFDDDGNLTSPVDNESVSTDELNTVYRIQSDNESRLRDLLNNTVGYGDKIVIDPGVTVTVSNGTLSVPDGVMFEGSAKHRNSGPHTLVKAFDGDLLEFGDWFTLKNISMNGDSDNYSGAGLVGRPGGQRELYWQDANVMDFESEAVRFNDVYLSTFINCTFTLSQYGIVLDGTGHSPHNLFARCMASSNTDAGIDMRQPFNRATFVECQIIENEGAGIDTTRSVVGQAWDAAIGPGTTIINNEGPGILLDGSDTSTIQLRTALGSRIMNNASDPDSGLTTPVGDVHAENGSSIYGEVYGDVGDIYRYNPSSVNGELTIAGTAGDIDAPNTYLTVLNDQKVDSFSAQSSVSLVPTGGGGLNLSSVETYSESNVTTTRSFDADATDTDELADVVGTLISDLDGKGIISNS